ncbi:hypothetical protein SK128_004901 [Halocaridina rubra]|uniref:Uncharacterized protein n=1 Tax=Halocaridina rubra TaxID=373956 RepID=A0AAN8X8P7_HALRR
MAPGVENHHQPQTIANKELRGYWGSKLKVREEPEVVTLTLGGSEGQSHSSVGLKTVTEKSDTSARVTNPMITIPHPVQLSANSWDDQLLRKLKGSNGKWRKILWRPGSGRHIDEGPSSYRPFTNIVRTLHLDDALQVIAKNRIEPKNIITFSSIAASVLPPDHPCSNLRILWFSAKLDNEKDDDPNWYGNVQFAVSCDMLVNLFKYCFLVEIMTTPTHTTSRLLLTNKDYSAVLPRYYRERTGGPWQVSSEGHKALIHCSRYKFRGENIFDHVLEFMLEVTQEDEHKLLSKCKISFMNHENAADCTIPHVCNRYQRVHAQCPTPYSCEETAQKFYEGIQQLPVNWKKLYSKLTDGAKEYLPKTK